MLVSETFASAWRAIGVRPLVDTLKGFGQLFRLVGWLNQRLNFAVRIEQGKMPAVVHQQLTIPLPVHKYCAHALGDLSQGVQIAGQAVEMLTKEIGIGLQ